MVRIVVMATVAALAAAGCGERASGFAVADAPEQASEERTYDDGRWNVTVDGPDLGPLVVSARAPDRRRGDAQPGRGVERTDARRRAGGAGVTPRVVAAAVKKPGKLPLGADDRTPGFQLGR